jgi:hypothetical protein
MNIMDLRIEEAENGKLEHTRSVGNPKGYSFAALILLD